MKSQLTCINCGKNDVTETCRGQIWVANAEGALVEVRLLRRPSGSTAYWDCKFVRDGTTATVPQDRLLYLLGSTSEVSRANGKDVRAIDTDEECPTRNNRWWSDGQKESDCREARGGRRGVADTIGTCRSAGGARFPGRHSV